MADNDSRIEHSTPSSTAIAASRIEIEEAAAKVRRLHDLEVWISEARSFIDSCRNFAELSAPLAEMLERYDLHLMPAWESPEAEGLGFLRESWSEHLGTVEAALAAALVSDAPGNVQ